MSTAARAKREERRKNYRAIQSQIRIVSVPMQDATGWPDRDVMVSIPLDETKPSRLVELGKSHSNRAVCPETGRVFQQTNGKYEYTGRAIHPNSVKAEMNRARIEIEDSYPAGCW